MQCRRIGLYWIPNSVECWRTDIQSMSRTTIKLPACTIGLTRATGRASVTIYGNGKFIIRSSFPSPVLSQYYGAYDATPVRDRE